MLAWQCSGWSAPSRVWGTSGLHQLVCPDRLPAGYEYLGTPVVKDPAPRQPGSCRSSAAFPVDKSEGMVKMMDEGWQSDPGDQCAWHDFVYEQRTEVIHTYKLKMLELAAPFVVRSRVLDVGSGTGQMARFLTTAGAQVTGIDWSPAGLRKAPDDVWALQANLEYALPFASEHFDAVWCTEVLEHVVSPLRLLRELCRVLKRGGRLFLTTPNSAFHLFRYLVLLGRTCSELQHPGHLQFFSERSLKRVLTEGGFQLERFLGRAVYLALPARFGRADVRQPDRLDGVVREDTLTRGPVLLVTRFIEKRVSFWADTFLVVAIKDASAVHYE